MTLAWALVALKSGFRTRFNTALLLIPAQGQRALPRQAVFTGHTAFTHMPQGTLRSLGPDFGLWKKNRRKPGIQAWSKHSTPQRKAPSQNFDPEPFFLHGAFLNRSQTISSSIRWGQAASTGAHYIAATVGRGRNRFHWWVKNVESRRKLSDCQHCQTRQECWLRARVSTTLP